MGTPLRDGQLGLHRAGAWALAPVVVLACLGLPVLLGLAAGTAQGLGYMPALGGEAMTLAHWRALMDWPGLGGAVRLSLGTGFAATLISLALTLALVALWQGTASFEWITRALAPLLSVPHAAAALGLAFLIAPSGWVARALSPWATGWERPPDLLIVHDPWGLSLVAGLVLKEVPFLLLMTLAALGQSDARRRMLVARALGYGRVTGWMKAVLPAIYRQIRLPVFAVLAYSMSVVDVALILGPMRPPTLAVQALEWSTHPDLNMRFRAAAAGCLQAVLVIAALALWVLGERVIGRSGRRWAGGGARAPMLDHAVRPVVHLGTWMIALGLGLGFAGLLLWSFAGLWRFPALLPESFSLRIWTGQSDALWRSGRDTVVIAVGASLIALLLVIATLEAEARRGRRMLGLWVIYLPLIVPQIALLPGLTSLGLILGLDGTRGAVLALHLVFVLPYVMLSLSDPWRAWDTRAGLVAQSLGASRLRVLLAVRLPMLTRAVLIALAIGFAVSVTQYLPTLLIGAGRVTTVTTEAVALAASGNRRLIGVWAVAQMVLPMLVFAAALALPALIFRNRQGVRAP